MKVRLACLELRRDYTHLSAGPHGRYVNHVMVIFYFTSSCKSWIYSGHIRALQVGLFSGDLVSSFSRVSAPFFRVHDKQGSLSGPLVNLHFVRISGLYWVYGLAGRTCGIPFLLFWHIIDTLLPINRGDSIIHVPPRLRGHFMSLLDCPLVSHREGESTSSSRTDRIETTYSSVSSGHCAQTVEENHLSIMLLVANLANTKWCKKAENPSKWVLIWEVSVRAIQWIPTWQGLDGFQKSLHHCALVKSSLSIGRV